MYADTNRYHDRLTSVSEILRPYPIPKELSNRIVDYVVSTWSIKKRKDTSQGGKSENLKCFLSKLLL